MNRKMRSQLRLALTTLVCVSPIANAQDRFIVQPRMRQQTEAEASPQGRTVAAPRQQDETELDLVPSAAEARFTGNRPSTSATPAAQLASNRHSVRVSNASQSSSRNQGLQWVTRGASITEPIARHGFNDVPSAWRPDSTPLGDGPIEFDNPEYFGSGSHQGNSANTHVSGAAQYSSQSTLNATADAEDSAPMLTREEEARQQREKIAELVSNRIIGDTVENDHSLPIGATHSGPGWGAVGERLTAHLQSCEAALRHNAYASAREEAEQAAVYLVRVLDLASNSYRAEPTWHLAIQALSEAEDFTMFQRMSVDTDTLRRIIDSHETTVLKGTDTRNVSPLVAAQHYRQFAEQQLIQASQGHPWASDVFYSMGRTFQAQAENADTGSDALRWKAVTFYRAAASVLPSNSMASNQLGYILLQMDRPQEAREALVASLGAKASTPALENLVEASRRLGDPSTINWAVQQLAINQSATQPAEAPMVLELEPREFIAISPRSSGPQSQSSSTPQIAAGYNGSPYPGSIQR